VSSHLWTLVLLTASLVLALWYATSEFIPYLPFADLGAGFDSFRYHVFAARNASSSAAAILASADAASFGQTGYPVLLSLLYGITRPDPLIGCIANWILWAVAGLLLAPLADIESGGSSRLPFLALWLLYPEGITWCGTTSKEVIVVFAVACAVRTCSSRILRWAQSLVVGPLAVGIFWVRSMAAPLLLLPLATSFEFRRQAPRAQGSRVLACALVAVLGLYLAGGASKEDIDTSNPLALAGYDKMDRDAADGLSRRSILRQMGSPNRVADLFYVPVRSMANLLCPLYLGPSAVTSVDAFCELLSAGLCFIAVWAVSLRLFDRERWTQTRAVLFGVFALGFLALGLSGIIHERYRSTIVAALLPLGMRSLREEVAVHGPRRLLVGGVVLPVSIFLVYRILRQLS